MTVVLTHLFNLLSFFSIDSSNDELIYISSSVTFQLSSKVVGIKKLNIFIFEFRRVNR